MALLEDLLGSTGTQVASTVANAFNAQNAIQNVQNLRQDILNQADQYVARGSTASQFQPFTVTAGSGTAQFDPAGGLTLNAAQQPLVQALQQAAGTTAGQLGQVSPMFGGLSQQALQQAQSTLGQATPTAQTLFEQMQAATAPEQERQRIELENRLAAQGRLGTQTAAYGGTPEALALEKAIQEQQSRNLVTAQTLAPQLAQQQTALASGLFGLGSQAAAQPTALDAANIANVQGLLTAQAAPQTQLIQALSPALTAAQLAQAGRASEAQLLGTLGPATLESMFKTGASEAGLQQAQINAILQGLGLGVQQDTAQNTVNTLTDDLSTAVTDSVYEYLGIPRNSNQAAV